MAAGAFSPRPPMHTLSLVLLLALAEPSVETLLARALAAEKEGRLEEAASSYHEALRLRPGVAALHGNLAWVRVRQGRLTEALSELERALALEPGDAPLHLALGRVLRDLGIPERALAAFESAVRLAPESREGYFELAALHQSRRELEAAASWLSRYLERSPGDVEGLYFLGTVLSYGNDFEGARAALEKVIAEEPAHPRAWFRKAHVEAQQPETMSAAVDSYRKSLELDEGDAYVWYEYGILLDKLDRAGEAIAAFERAIALDPELAVASYALGNRLSRSGRVEEARDHLERFKRARDEEERRDAEAKRALSAFARGRELLEENRLDAAVEAFLEMTELNPRAHQGYAFLAKAHFSRKEVPVAIAYIRRARELSPGTSEYPYLLGLFLRERGELDQARSALEDAVALDPASAAFYNALGVLLEEAGSPEEALASFEKAVALEPGNPAYLLNLALASEKLGLSEKAERAFARYREQLGIR